MVIEREGERERVTLVFPWEEELRYIELTLP